MPLYGDSPSTFSSHAPVLDRHLEGLTALLLSLKKGIIQAIDLATGTILGERDLGQPLATGLVPFEKRYLVAAHDGTLLEVEQP